MRPFGTLAFFASAVALSGCWSEGAGGGGSANCYTFQCTDVFTIYVTRRDAEAFIPGQYTFSIDDDAVTTRCDIRSDGSLRCTGDNDTLSVSITPANEEYTLRLDGTPVTLSIDVLMNGELIGAEELTPEYQIIFSDDPGCEDSCLHGSQIIGVQSPPEKLRLVNHDLVKP